MNKATVFLTAFALNLLPVLGYAQAEVGRNVVPSFAPLAAKLLPAVVNISTTYTKAQPVESPRIDSSNPSLRDYFLLDEGGHTSLGSGFLVDAKGYIVTNHHVIKDAASIEVRLNDGSTYPAEVIGYDEPTDLSLIKIAAQSALPYVNLGDSDALNVGDWVLTIGNPFGLGSSVTAGIVSAKSRDIDMGSYDNFIQTDAAINQGSSGGPMFDMSGLVVGINTALYSSSGESVGVGFATPVNLSKFVIAQLMEKGRVERGWIGVKAAANLKEIPISAGQTFRGGVVLTEIITASPAALAGCAVDDVVLAINGRDVDGLKNFSRTIAEAPLNQDLMLRLWRSGKTLDVSLKTALAPEPDAEPLLSSSADSSSPEANAAAAFATEADLPVISDSADGFIDELGFSASDTPQGVVIDELSDDSQSARQGLKSGDLITQANSRSVASLADLVSYIGYAAASDGKLQLQIMRDGQSHNVALEVPTL